MKSALLALGLCSGLLLAAPASAHSRAEVYVDIHPSSHWSYGWRQPAWYGGHHHRHRHGGALWCGHHRVYHEHAYGHREHRRDRGHRDRDWHDDD